MEIINKVAQSNLISFDLEEYFPSDEIVVFDLKNYLFRELILKEKDFRESLIQFEWSQYQGKNLAITCSNDSIIPQWAYMLVVVYAEPFAKTIRFGNADQVLEKLFLDRLDTLSLDKYKDQRIVIKGCSNKPVPQAAFVHITRMLRPIAKSIMYGEPCSTVPLFKRK